MRFEGTLVSWNTQHGFGFIEPLLGGDLIFVHVRAFEWHPGVPPLRCRVSFEVEIDAERRKSAKSVQIIEGTGADSRRPSRARTRAVPPSNNRALLAPLGFVCIYAAATIAWDVPGWAAAWYVVASTFSFAAYAHDKSAARSGAWRISENTLLTLGLIGGWPGAVLAQQALRHKTRKRGFQLMFWITAVLNTAAFIVSAPELAGWMRDVIAANGW